MAGLPVTKNGKRRLSWSLLIQMAAGMTTIHTGPASGGTSVAMVDNAHGHLVVCLVCGRI